MRFWDLLYCKVQPFIAIMSSALIIGLGFMFGAILQVSGGVEVIADTLLKVFGEKKLRGHLESLV